MCLNRRFSARFVVFWRCLLLLIGTIFHMFSRAMQHVQIVLPCRRQHDFSCFEGVPPGLFLCITFAVILIPFWLSLFASFLTSWVSLNAFLARLWPHGAPSDLPNVLLHGGVPGFLGLSRTVSFSLDVFVQCRGISGLPFNTKRHFGCCVPSFARRWPPRLSKRAFGTELQLIFVALV